MPKITYIDSTGNKKTIDVASGLSVMEGAVQNSIPGIDADCGGGMACATCHVYVKDEWFNKLPKTNNGLIDAYKEIIPALIKQKDDKCYFIKKELPETQNI